MKLMLHRPKSSQSEQPGFVRKLPMLEDTFMSSMQRWTEPRWVVAFRTGFLMSVAGPDGCNGTSIAGRAE